MVSAALRGWTDPSNEESSETDAENQGADSGREFRKL